jgi:prevent-host-death family protein
MDSTIAVSELKSNLMKILKEIESGSTLTITSGGKAIAKLVPPDDRRKYARERLKEISKTAIIRDVVSPIDESWEAEGDDNS